MKEVIVERHCVNGDTFLTKMASTLAYVKKGGQPMWKKQHRDRSDKGKGGSMKSKKIESS